MANKKGTLIVWALRHPDLGWVKFLSYRIVETSPDLIISACYMTEKAAERRRKNRFYKYTKPGEGKPRQVNEYPGSSLEIVPVRIEWESP